MKTTIKLHGGIFFDFLNPEACDFSMETVAHHLAQGAVRYSGGLSEQFSVAQHSVLVDDIVQNLVEDLRVSDPEEYWRTRLDALLHDATEFVMGDMTTPLKNLCPDFQAHEKRINNVFADKLGYRANMGPVIRQADLIARYIETYNFDPHFDGATTTVHQGEPIPGEFLHWKLTPMTWRQAKQLFISRYMYVKAWVDTFVDEPATV
jgi:5'-deoxynucleotidase YfbR-like HD superfamily hydrolase